MTHYLSDSAHLALCDAICDSEILCDEFGIMPDPYTGFPTPERAAFELCARFSIVAERHRHVIELEALLEGIRDAVREWVRRLRPVTE